MELPPLVPHRRGKEKAKFTKIIFLLPYMWGKTKCIVMISMNPSTKSEKIHDPWVRSSDPMVGPILPYTCSKNVFKLRKTSSLPPCIFEKNLNV